MTSARMCVELCRLIFQPVENQVDFVTSLTQRVPHCVVILARTVTVWCTEDAHSTSDCELSDQRISNKKV